MVAVLDEEVKILTEFFAFDSDSPARRFYYRRVSFQAS